MKLNREFYQQNSYDLALSLLGKVLIINNKSYRIVETEAYGGITDKAAHSYNNTRTPRTEVMYMDGGHLYIYLIYGMYFMLNIVASKLNNPEAVLIRAVEPLVEKSNKLTTNGPGKLCKHLGIDKSFNGVDLVSNENIYIIDDGFKSSEIVKTKRIGVDYAEEDKDRLWRFYLKYNQYVSKK